MIDYVRGILAEKSIDHAVIEAGGVGFYLEIPLSTFEALGDPGAEACVLTHHYVREDAQKLYGFCTRGERDAFRQLIAVTKIGPRVALSILSRVSPRELGAAVASQDPARLKAIPGVGPKTAQRLVMELKGRVGELVEAGAAHTIPEGESALRSGGRREALDALVTLGYSEKMVQEALDRVAQVSTGELSVEEWIRKALQVI